MCVGGAVWADPSWRNDCRPSLERVYASFMAGSSWTRSLDSIVLRVKSRRAIAIGVALPKMWTATVETSGWYTVVTMPLQRWRSVSAAWVGAADAELTLSTRSSGSQLGV